MVLQFVAFLFFSLSKQLNLIFLTVPSDAKNGYRIGNSLNLSLGCVVFIGVALLRTYQARENRLREQGKRDHRLACSEEEQEQLGSKHPKFRFYL